MNLHELTAEPPHPDRSSPAPTRDALAANHRAPVDLAPPAPELSCEALVAAHSEMVFRTLYRLLGPPRGELEDLAQEVFLRLLRALRGFRGDSQLTTYLYRITVNVANDELRRRGAARRREVAVSDEELGWENRLPSGERDPERQLRDREFTRALHLAMCALKAAERSVLVLYHGEELSYEAIAAALGLPINTVRTHLHRGRAKLRERLSAQGWGTPLERRPTPHA